MNLTDTDFKVGFNSHRLKEEDPYYKTECDFVKVINKELRFSKNYLAQIVNHPKHKDWLEEDEEKIVLSVIQWLGTPIGQDFLEKVKNINTSEHTNQNEEVTENKNQLNDNASEKLTPAELAISKAIKEVQKFKSGLHMTSAMIYLNTAQKIVKEFVDKTKFPENFFCGDEFCTDLCDLMTYLDIEEEDVDKLDDDWEITLELTNLEPLIDNIGEKQFEKIAQNICEMFDHRIDFEELTDSDERMIVNAIKTSFDVKKFKSMIPTAYYPNKQMLIITKQDLINFCK